MKKEFNLVTSKCLAYVVNGVGWLVYAFLLIFDNPVCLILASVALLICVTISIKSRRYATESDDEMSKYNLMKAKATTMDWLKIIMCVILLLFVIVGLLHEFFPVIKETFHISLGLLVPLILGITEIAIGFLFVKYEKDGE